MPVDLVTIHHEGAGSPSDTARGADGGYSYWIGTTRWERLRSPYSSFATLHFNHVSLDICLSGNRMDHDVTSNDIALIRGAYMDARARGEIVDAPRVQAHRDNNGKYTYQGNVFSTVCPGDRTMARWNEIVAACHAISPAPPPPAAPTWREPVISLWHPEDKGIWIVMDKPPGAVSFVTRNGAVLPQGMDQDRDDRIAFGDRHVRLLEHRTRNDGTPGFKIRTVENTPGYVPKNQR